MNENAREVLKELYVKLFEELNTLPETLPYRVSLQRTILDRLRIINAETNPIRLEEELDAGQLEILIQYAEKELEIIPQLVKEKTWESEDWNRPIELYSDVRNH